MKVGSLSPIIETQEGLTLLRCTGVFEPKAGTFEEARDSISKRLRKERFDTAWKALNRELLAKLRPVYHPEIITSDASDDPAVITYRQDDHSKSVSLGEYRAFLVRKHLSEDAIGHERHLELLESRMLLEAQAHEAGHRGLIAVDEVSERIKWTQLELKARIALDASVAPLVTLPTKKDITALYSRRKDELVSPEKLHLQTLEMPIDQGIGRALYDRFEGLGSRLATGDIDLEAAARELSPHAKFQDLGWMTMDQVWMMGRNATDAIERLLESGGYSPAVQEGPVLRIFHLAGHRDQRILSLAEAQPRLEAALIAARKRQAEEKIRKTILREQKIEVLQ